MKTTTPRGGYTRGCEAAFGHDVKGRLAAKNDRCICTKGRDERACSLPQRRKNTRGRRKKRGEYYVVAEIKSEKREGEMMMLRKSALRGDKRRIVVRVCTSSGNAAA